MGLGFFQRPPKIAVRMLTRDVNETVDGAFLRRRIEAAWQNRRLLGF